MWSRLVKAAGLFTKAGADMSILNIILGTFLAAEENVSSFTCQVAFLPASII